MLGCVHLGPVRWHEWHRPPSRGPHTRQGQRRTRGMKHIAGHTRQGEGPRLPHLLHSTARVVVVLLLVAAGRRRRRLQARAQCPPHTHPPTPSRAPQDRQRRAPVDEASDWAREWMNVCQVWVTAMTATCIRVAWPPERAPAPSSPGCSARCSTQHAGQPPDHPHEAHHASAHRQRRGRGLTCARPAPLPHDAWPSAAHTSILGPSNHSGSVHSTHSQGEQRSAGQGLSPGARSRRRPSQRLAAQSSPATRLSGYTPRTPPYTLPTVRMRARSAPPNGGASAGSNRPAERRSAREGACGPPVRRTSALTPQTAHPPATPSAPLTTPAALVHTRGRPASCQAAHGAGRTSTNTAHSGHLLTRGAGPPPGSHAEAPLPCPPCCCCRQARPGPRLPRAPPPSRRAQGRGTAQRRRRPGPRPRPPWPPAAAGPLAGWRRAWLAAAVPPGRSRKGWAARGGVPRRRRGRGRLRPVVPRPQR